MPTCDFNLDDLQDFAEILVSQMSALALVAFVVGYLVADPHAPLRLIVTFRRFFRKARQ